jgi:hypothetical protein
MKITTSNQVDVEITGEEILKALFNEGNKALYELKKALDKLEFDELVEPSEEDIKRTQLFSDEELQEMLSQKADEIWPIMEEKPSSDTKVPLSPKEPVKSIENKPKRKYHRRHKHNKKKVKPVRKYSVAPKDENVTFVGKTKPVKNDEDDPIIRPAVRPKTNNIEVNVI